MTTAEYKAVLAECERLIKDRREPQCPRCQELMVALKEVVAQPLWINEPKLQALIARVEAEWK